MPEKLSWSHSKSSKCRAFRNSKHHVHLCILSGISKHLCHFRNSRDDFKSPQAVSVQVLALIMNLSKIIMIKCPILVTHASPTNTALAYLSVSHQQQHKSRCENLKLLSRRETHTWVERLRRSELRELFDKLHSILQCNPKPPRLHLLSMVSAILCKSLRKVQRHSERSYLLDVQPQ